MAISVPNVSEVAAKWKDVTPGRARYYEVAAPAAAAEWERASLAAESNYRAGISVGGIERRFTGGIRRAGAAKFARKVKEVGAPRFAQGVNAAVSDYQSGVAPYLETIASISLPMRAPRGDPGNIERVRVVAQALAAKRLATLGAG